MPTVLGVLTNELAPGFVRALKPVLPLIGVALTTLLCASPCAQVASILKCARGLRLKPMKTHTIVYAGRQHSRVRPCVLSSTHG